MCSLSDICALCLVQTQNLKSILSEDVDGTVLEDKLKMFLMELINFLPNIPKYICNNCILNVNSFYKFKIKCVENITTLSQRVQRLEVHKEPPNFYSITSIDTKSEKVDPLEHKKQSESENDCIPVESIFIKEEPQNEFHEYYNFMEGNNQSEDINAEIKSSVNISTKQEFDTVKHIEENINASSNNPSASAGIQNMSELQTKKRYECQLCYKAYSDPSGVREHEQRVHKLHDPQQLENDSLTSNEINTAEHIEENINASATSGNTQNMPKIKSKPANTKKRFKCTQCDRQFVKPSHLKTHSRIHTGLRPYKCTTCNKTFNLTHDLKKHMRIHTGEKPYECKVCHKAFNSSSGVREHERTHDNVKPFKCSVCNKAFTKSASLRIHMRVHTGERPFLCHLCDLKFAHKGNLKLHLQRHAWLKPYL